MAKDLPQFQKGVALQPVALPDMQGPGDLLASKLQNFATLAGGLVSKEHKTELDAQKMAAQVQIRDGFTNLREKSLDPTTFDGSALNRYDAGAKGITAGILSTAPDKLKPALSNFISYYGDRNRNVVGTRVNKLATEQLKGSAREYVSKITNDAVNAEMSNDTIPAKDGSIIHRSDMLIGQLNNHLDTYQKTGLFPSSEVEKMRQGTFKQVETAKYMNQFQQNLAKESGNPQKWLDKFNESKQVPANIKPTVTTKALGMMRRVQSAQKAQQAGIRSDAKDVVTKVQNGALDADSPVVYNLQNRMKVLPQSQQDIYNGKIAQSSIIATAKTEMHGMNKLHRDDVIDRMTPKLGEPGFEFKNKIHKSLISISNELEAEFKKDSFTYVSHDPDVIRASEARLTSANDGTKKIQGDDPQSNSPLAVSMQKQKELGAVDVAQVKGQTETSAMGKPQATAIVAELDSFPETPDGMKQKVNLVEDLAAKYGRFSKIASRDLANAGAPQNVLDLAGLENIPNSSAFLQSIYASVSQPNAIKKQLKINEDSSKKWIDYQNESAAALKPILDTFGNTKDSVEFKNNMINLVATTAAGYSLSNNDSVRHSAKIMSAAIYHNRYSAILNGARIRKDIPEDNAKAAMFAMTKNIPDTKFAPLTRDPTGKALTSKESATEDRDIIKAGHWRTIRGDEGLYWVDGNGFTPHLDGTNKRYEIRWDELKDKTSPLNELIAKHPRTFLSRLGLSTGSSPAIEKPQTDESKIMNILNKNSNKNFVQRILKPEGKPILPLKSGEFATHKMSWATVDGKPIVYPKVIQDSKTGKLKELSSEDAVKHAIKTKEFITMKNNKEAEWFSSNYKKVWDIKNRKIALKKGIK